MAAAKRVSGSRKGVNKAIQSQREVAQAKARSRAGNMSIRKSAIKKADESRAQWTRRSNNQDKANHRLGRFGEGAPLDGEKVKSNRVNSRGYQAEPIGWTENGKQVNGYMFHEFTSGDSLKGGYRMKQGNAGAAAKRAAARRKGAR